MPDQNIEVQWKIASDKKNGKVQRVVQDGTMYPRPEYAHSVHVEPEGLKPNTEYYYQFKVSSYRSPIGRTKTAPASGTDLNQLTFALASCQYWLGGRYAAYKNMAEEDLDFVVHVGDYIYEHRDTNTLADYRRLHALYKTSPDLQAAHAAFPFIVTFDDHKYEMSPAEALDYWAVKYQHKSPDEWGAKGVFNLKPSGRTSGRRRTN